MMNNVQVKNYFKGQFIFKEGSEGEQIFLIKSGKVEIYKNLSGQVVLIATLGPGDVFGEIPVKISNNPFISICRILTILASSSENGPSGRIFSSDRKNGKEIAFDKVSEVVQDIVSISSIDLENIFKKMNSVNLISFTEIKKEKHILIKDPVHFFDQAMKIYNEFKDAFTVYFSPQKNVIELEELAKLYKVPPDTLCKKIGWGEIPNKLFFFHKNEIVNWISEQPGFFNPKKIMRKRLDQLESIGDIVCVDDETLQAVLAEVDIIKVCKVIKNAEKSIQKKIFSNLSKRMQNVIRQTLKEITTVDPAENADTEDAIISMIKKLKKVKV